MNPIGAWRDDFRVAQLCAVIANSAMGSKGRARIKDFMPDFDNQKPAQTPEDLKNKIARLNAILGGKVE